MTIVRVEARMTFIGAIVAQIACLECLGEKEVTDAHGFVDYCEACNGCGMLDMEAELEFVNRRRHLQMWRSFRGAG